MNNFKTKFFGDKTFYKMVLSISLPIMVQNGITNFVGLLDNIMIGKIGTLEMSGPAIVNQILFVYMLCIFGAVSGAGIFTAQYYGQKDNEGIRDTFRFKLWIGIALTTVAIVFLYFFKDNLISMYLRSENTSAEDAAATLSFGRAYMNIMLIGLPGLMISQVYASTLRECGETKVPMVAGIISVIVNLTLNYTLIYGHFGAPQLGVAGAAIATVISRYIEAGIVVLRVHICVGKYPFAKGLFASLKVPGFLVKKIIIKGTPLLFNETLWAAGMAVLNQCYSTRGISVVAATNISSTISNIFNIVFIALGDTVAIVIGQLLGEGDMQKAKDTDRKMITFSVLCSMLIGLIMFITAPLFPRFYNTTIEAKEIATDLIRIAAAFMPFHAFMHASYFTLRSGGKTIITFLFDSGFVWTVSVGIAFILSRFTNLNVQLIVIAVSLGDLIKCVIGFILVQKGVWLQNIVKK